MQIYTSAIRSLIAAAAGIGLVACGSSGGGGDNAANNASTGTVSFAATDAPVDNVSTVQVTFDAIALQPQDGERIMFEFDPPRTLDLLTLQGNDSELILDDTPPLNDDTEVPAGDYNFIRLFVLGGAPDSFVDEDSGARQDLLIPGQQGNSNARRFLQLNSGFTVPAGGDADFTIDFQLRQALTQPPGQGGAYFLRPSLRLVNNVEVGTIQGTVDDSLVNDDSCTNDLSANSGAGEGNAVYLYAGADATAGDVNLDNNGDPDHAQDDSDTNASEVNPVTVADVTLDADTGNYDYTIGFVREGTYTIAFTCQSLDDEPDTDEAIVFVQPTDVAVTANQTSTVNFSAAAGDTVQ